MILSLPAFVKRFRVEETGAVLVETAIILPLMITLSAGVYEFSNAIYTRLLLEAGVTDASRYLARCVHADSDSTKVAICITRAKNLAVCGTVSDTDLGDCSATATTIARVNGWTTGAVSISNPLPQVSVLDPTTGDQLYRSSTDHISIADVSTDYSYAGTGLLGVLGFGPLTLSVAHQERVIGW